MQDDPNSALAMAEIALERSRASASSKPRQANFALTRWRDRTGATIADVREAARSE
jgi:hypothetical protein